MRDFETIVISVWLMLGFLGSLMAWSHYGRKWNSDQYYNALLAAIWGGIFWFFTCLHLRIQIWWEMKHKKPIIVKADKRRFLHKFPELVVSRFGLMDFEDD